MHAVRSDEICATEVIWSGEANAEEYARELSTDPGVLAGAVTKFALDVPGQRTPVALFVDGKRQDVPHLSNDRRVAANGWTAHPTLRRKERRAPG